MVLCICSMDGGAWQSLQDVRDQHMWHLTSSKCDAFLSMCRMSPLPIWNSSNIHGLLHHAPVILL
ncbi:unnamed protein product [Staurois parvus]|uniref:Uncharacterized protein n=1 Tax=Staurois parvus TaxID=386267 RepID=A0ABN9G0A1_9NEOB|nr:unnamed protein product [Staurois parvus]